MLAALTIDDVLSRAPMHGSDGNPTGERLISIVFAGPTSPVWTDLRQNYVGLEQTSGQKWDLYFAGISLYGPNPGESQPTQLRDWNDPQAPAMFLNMDARDEMIGTISDGIASSDIDVWDFSGSTDLVSFMCYSGEPDWASSKAVTRVLDDLDLYSITKELVDWKSPRFNSRLAPGNDPYGPLLLGPALKGAGAAIGGGVVYDLLKLAIDAL